MKIEELFQKDEVGRNSGGGSSDMATQIVMDVSGDSRYEFDENDRDAVAKAEQRFKKLIGDGFTPAIRTSAGKTQLLRSFDPNAKETVFFPRLVGG